LVSSPLLLIVWEVLARRFGNPLFVAPPSATARGDGGALERSGRRTSAACSTGEIAVAFAIAVRRWLIALPLG